MATADSSFIFSTGEDNDSAEFYKYDQGGNLVWTQETYFTIYDISATINNELYLLADQGLWIYNIEDGTQMQYHPQILGENIEINSDSTFVVLGRDSISIYSNDFEPIENINLPTGQYIEDYYLTTEMIAILTTGNKVFLLDYNLNEINNFILEESSPSINTIAVKNSEVLVSGSTRNGFTGAINSSAFIKKYGLDGEKIETQNDVGVISISPTLPHIYGGNFYGLIAMDFPALIIEVTNFGETPINKLTLNSRHPTLSISSWCPFTQEFSKTFSGLDIQPGETEELIWYDYKIWFKEYPEGNVDICIWTSKPNSESDLDGTNDATCLDFPVSDREVFQNSNFSISPNPASGPIKIKYTLPSSTAEIIITNSIGQINSRYFLEHMEGELIIDNLPAGLYFISLIAEGKTVGTERLVVY